MRCHILLPLLVLAACSPAADPEPDNGLAAPPAAIAPATSSAEAEAIAAGQARAADAAGAAQPLNWIGRFAATPALCTGGVWDFEQTRVVTDGETSCSINKDDPSGGRVELNLSCSAEGMDTRETWALTPNGADGISVARETGTETINVDLIRCG